MFQTTIAKESLAEGVGLHTGVYGHVRLMPAPAETGIVFRRVDLENFPIEAQGHNVARVSYATSLMKQGVLLSTTEHLLAAIFSCGIDNRSEEHTSELQSLAYLVCRLLLEKKKKNIKKHLYTRVQIKI